MRVRVTYKKNGRTQRDPEEFKGVKSVHHGDNGATLLKQPGNDIELEDVHFVHVYEA